MSRTNTARSTNGALCASTVKRCFPMGERQLTAPLPHPKMESFHLTLHALQLLTPLQPTFSHSWNCYSCLSLFFQFLAQHIHQ